MQIEMFCSWKSDNNFCVGWECLSAEIIPILCTFSCGYTWLFESESSEPPEYILTQVDNARSILNENY